MESATSKGQTWGTSPISLTFVSPFIKIGMVGLECSLIGSVLI